MRKDKAGGGARAPWMPFYGRDFYADVHVRAMTWEERGVYQFLLWVAWDEGAIPADTKKLARICELPARRFTKVWEAIGDRWQPHQARAGWLVNRRQEQVRSESGALSERMRQLATRRWEQEAAGRIESGQHIPSDPQCDIACDPASPPHAPPHSDTQCDAQCETGSDPARDVAMLTTTTATTTATVVSQSVGSRTEEQYGEGLGTAVPGDVSDAIEAVAGRVPRG